jgi:hypothetical protein
VDVKETYLVTGHIARENFAIQVQTLNGVITTNVPKSLHLNKLLSKGKNIEDIKTIAPGLGWKVRLLQNKQESNNKVTGSYRTDIDRGAL